MLQWERPEPKSRRSFSKHANRANSTASTRSMGGNKPEHLLAPVGSEALILVANFHTRSWNRSGMLPRERRR